MANADAGQERLDKAGLILEEAFDDIVILGIDKAGESHSWVSITEKARLLQLRRASKDTLDRVESNMDRGKTGK